MYRGGKKNKKIYIITVGAARKYVFYTPYIFFTP